MFGHLIILSLLSCGLTATIDPRYVNKNDGRIVGGRPTTIEKFPYQVSLQRNNSLFCGGSLYNADTVITAAHCLQSVEPIQLKIRLGTTTHKFGGEYISVRTFKTHERYDANRSINDVAVIKLETPVRFSAKVQPIPLATVIPTTGTSALVTGWGTNKFLVGSIQDILQVAEVNLIRKNDCASNKYKYGSQILDTMICAAVEGGGKDACQGDSGGPLVAGGKLVGVVSWGNMCGRKNYPGVYASIPELHPWIVKTARDL